MKNNEGGSRVEDVFKKSLPGMPLVSVITVSLNAETCIEKTIKSVIAQDYSNIEYIIVDGDSSDGTLKIIKQYDDFIDYWISEKDTGISNAFNKAIRLAGGKYIGIINAGDWYMENAVSTIIKNGKYDVIFGNAEIWKNNNKWFYHKSDFNMMKYSMSICHPTVFIRKAVYHKCGLFNEHYKYAMDYELLIRIMKEGYKFFNTNTVLAGYTYTGVSNTNDFKAKLEVYKVMKSYQLNSQDKNIYYLNKAWLKIFFSRLLRKSGLGKIVDIYSRFFSKQKTNVE